MSHPGPVADVEPPVLGRGRVVEKQDVSRIETRHLPQTLVSAPTKTYTPRGPSQASVKRPAIIGNQTDQDTTSNASSSTPQQPQSYVELGRVNPRVKRGAKEWVRTFFGERTDMGRLTQFFEQAENCGFEVTHLVSACIVLDRVRNAAKEGKDVANRLIMENKWEKLWLVALSFVDSMMEDAPAKIKDLSNYFGVWPSGQGGGTEPTMTDLQLDFMKALDRSSISAEELQAFMSELNDNETKREVERVRTRSDRSASGGPPGIRAPGIRALSEGNRGPLQAPTDRGLPAPPTAFHAAQQRRPTPDIPSLKFAASQPSVPQAQQVFATPRQRNTLGAIPHQVTASGSRGPSPVMKSSPAVRGQLQGYNFAGQMQTGRIAFRQ